MWDKAFRLIVFTVIYEKIYWGSEFELSKVDLNLIQKQYNKELTIADQSHINDILSKLEFELESYIKILKSFSHNWEKTYDIVQAIMVTALIEKSEFNDLDTENLRKLVGKYIQLAQDMIGGNNPALVHALLEKIFHLEKKEMSVVEEDEEEDNDEND